MRSTQEAHYHFNGAMTKTAKGKHSIDDLSGALNDMAYGLSYLDTAIGQIYDKLQQIDRKMGTHSAKR